MGMSFLQPSRTSIPDLRLAGGRLTRPPALWGHTAGSTLIGQGTVAAGLCSPAAMGHRWAAPGLPSLLFLLLLLCCGNPLLVPSQETTLQVTTSQESTSSWTTPHQSMTSIQTTQGPSGTGWGQGGAMRVGRQGWQRAQAKCCERARGDLFSFHSVPQAW